MVSFASPSHLLLPLFLSRLFYRISFQNLRYYHNLRTFKEYTNMYTSTKTQTKKNIFNHFRIKPQICTIFHPDKVPHPLTLSKSIYTSYVPLRTYIYFFIPCNIHVQTKESLFCSLASKMNLISTGIML